MDAEEELDLYDEFGNYIGPGPPPTQRAITT